MEAGPSAITEDSITGNPRLECAHQKHSIFLSHSGAQKAFVRRLRKALKSNAYLPFFDEDPDCLPKGEPFAHRIKDMCQLADVAVVVLSDEFFKRKWPMIELAIFIQEQRRRISVQESKELKVLPLFMGLSIEEFRSAERQICWLEKWNEFGATDSRIDISEWKQAVKVLGGTNGLEYCRYKTEEEYIDSIVEAIFKLVSPDFMWDDTHMKGRSKFHQVVAKMFARSPSRTRFHNVRAIGLYGVGGIGKTTLCKSLCNDYLAKFNGKVWHAELGKKSAEDIQKDVLYHLVGISTTLLNENMDYKGQWRSLLRRKINHKVFLAIDNVWNEDESQEQAEALLEMDFHPDSLVFITSRSCELLEWLGIEKRCCFEMPSLDKGDAKDVLLEFAAPRCDIQNMPDYQQVAIDKVVERCFMTKGPICSASSKKQYVPLALKVLGRQLRLPLNEFHVTNLTKWVNDLDLKWSNQKQHPIFSILRLSYDNLPSSKHKNIFFDVALCVPRQHDNTSANLNEVCKWLSMVYCEDTHVILKILEDLQTEGLVERCRDLASPVGMHELYSEFVKSEVTKEDNFDKQNYLYHEDGLHVPAIMRKHPCHRGNYWPLRRIHIYNGGFKELTSREFKYMVNVEVLKLDFCFELESLDLQCLKSLQSVELRGCFQLQMVEGLEDLEDLKFFRWNTCRNSIVVANFPRGLEVAEIYGSKESELLDIGSFEECFAMLEVTLSWHPLLATISDLSKLHKLEKVDFSGCCRITEVRGLEGLSHLRHLNLQNCKKLRHCNGWEKLPEIETLNFDGCENVSLPEVLDLSQLVKLRSINIVGNLMVQRLVLSNPQFEQLEVMGCSKLRTVALPSDSGSWKFLSRLNEQRMADAVEFRQWTVDCGTGVEDRKSFDAYETLNLSNWHTLESLGAIGLLSSLKYLYLQNCNRLKTLPPLNNSPHLKVVDLSYCCMLEDLGGIGSMKALEYLYLQKCRSLLGLRGLYTPCLKVLDLSYCSKLEYLRDFDSMRSLQILNLNDCVSLETMPNLSQSPLLEVLNLQGCIKLRALTEMTTDNVVIDISKCWNLRKIPILNDLAILELDVSIGRYERLKLTCQRYGGSERLDQYSQSDVYSRKDSVPGCCSKREAMGFWFNRPNYFPLLDWEEWFKRGYHSCVNPTVIGTFVKISSISITCDTVTRFPYSAFFSGLSRLEITKCKRLRDLSGIEYLPTLENLVISECEELENLPVLSTATALKHLTIRGFRQGPKFQFLSYLCQAVSPHAKIKRPPVYNFTNLVELTFDGCVGLGGLYHWGPLPALESLLIKDCHSVSQLPDLRSSPKLSSVIVMNCGELKEVVDLHSAKALRVLRVEGCNRNHEDSTSISSRDRVCRELEDALRRSFFWELEGDLRSPVIRQMIRWLHETQEDSQHLDIFSGFDFFEVADLESAFFGLEKKPYEPEAIRGGQASGGAKESSRL